MPDELNTLYVRITAKTEFDTCSYTKEVNLADELEMWNEWTTNGANPRLEGVSFDQYYKPVNFALSLMREFNGKHFIFGYLEALMQSDDCPPFIFEAADEATSIEVLWNADL
jgi:hypothetical protein